MIYLRTASCHYCWIVAIGIFVLGHSLAGFGMADRRKDAPARIVDTVNVNALQAAIEDLIDSFGNRYPDGPKFLRQLRAIGQRGTGGGDAGRAELAALQPSAAGLSAATKGIWWFGREICARRANFDRLQCKALLANPLISGQSILFVVRHQYATDHHNTATIFQTGEINTHKFRGPGAIKVLDFRNGGKVRTLLEIPDGVARDPDVSFDGQHILFSMRKNEADDYHLYQMNADGTELKQLTMGKGVSDIDPLYLPDGRIAFTSTREPKYCMCNRHIMGNLFRMNADGTRIHQIGRSTLFEGHGALLPDGRILYDRWEYVDRNFGDGQGLWTCHPDGTHHAIYWGNNTKSPGGILDGHILPGSSQAIAVFSSCHDRPWGALALIDPQRGLDGVSPVIRTWPADAIKLVMQGNYDTFKKVSPKYEDPYPLSDKYFLCSRQTSGSEQMGVFLVDIFGNELLLHFEEPGCFDPMPLSHRPLPPSPIADRVKLDQDTGRFFVYDVYQGTGMERVPRGTVKFLRVVESPEKRFWSPANWKGAGTQAPGMNWHDFNNKRILGTVPVEPDGSACFDVPADRFVFFQLLDENGMMIQSMRSGTIVRPGETQGCVGCHDKRNSAVPNAATLAFHHAPHSLEPWHGPARIFNYVTEIQPVWDRYCVACHDYGQPAGALLNLAGDFGLIFNTSYAELWSKKEIQVVGGGPAEVLPPYSWGSHPSKLVKLLQDGHYDVQLDAESFDRIVTWVDINAPYYPSYASVYPDHLYGRSPLTDSQLARLSELVDIDLRNQRNITQLSFTRPERSLCLTQFVNRHDPAHAEALAIIRAGAEILAQHPRPDMAGFQLLGNDVEREAKYESLWQAKKQSLQAILRDE